MVPFSWLLSNEVIKLCIFVRKCHGLIAAYNTFLVISKVRCFKHPTRRKQSDAYSARHVAAYASFQNPRMIRYLKMRMFITNAPELDPFTASLSHVSLRLRQYERVTLKKARQR